MKSSLLMVAFFGFFVFKSNGQTTGDYRSKQTGDWADVNSWERYNGASWVNASAAPSDADGVISIRNAHNISIQTDVTADQIIVVSGGTLTMPQAFGGTFTLNNGLGDDLLVNGTFHFQNGNLSGTGNVLIGASGILLFTDPAGKVINAPITNTGTINWNDGLLNVQPVAFINNNIFNFATSSDFLAPGTFVNNGTINMNAIGSVNLNVQQWTNSGTLNFNNGTIVHNSNLINSGVFNFSNNSVFSHNGDYTHNPGASVQGTGVFQNNNTIILASNLNFPATITFNSPLFTNVSGNGNLTINRDFIFEMTNSATGVFTVNGNIDFQQGGLNQSTTIANGRTLTFSTPNPKAISGNLTNNGTVNWQDGNLGMAGGAVFLNNNIFNISNNGNFSQSGGAENFINAGTLSKSSTGLTTLNISVINNASAIIKGVGEFNLAHNFVSNGIIAPGLSPGILSMTGNFSYSPNNTLSIEIAGAGGAGQPTGHDLLQSDFNTIALQGTLTVTETGAVPFGDYTVFDMTGGGTISGTFNTLNLPAGYVVLYFNDSVVVRKVCVPSVSIAANPGNTICAGTNVTFTATPVNGGTPTYQWKRNGSNVGTNSNTYANTGLVNGDIITCVMTSSLSCTNGSPMATSNQITMTVNPILIPSVNIAASPGNTICAGVNVTFTATPVNGGTTPAYQWKLNGNNVGTNSPTYMNASLANSDVVNCVLTSNALCATPTTANSNTITMTVNPVLVPSVSIVANPGNTICAGTSVTFTATPTNGGATPAFQWKLNGNNVGSSSTTYVNASLANGDIVTCVLSSSYICPSPATATSNTVTMTVNPILVSSISIAANPGNTICAGANVTFTATPTNGGTTPAYQWKLNGNNVGSNSNTYANATLTNGDVVSCVLTSNALCAAPSTANSNNIIMTVNPILTPAVSIAASPGNTICANTNVTFTATPTNGGAAPAYQWKLNGGNVGTNISTYMNATLVNGDAVSCVMTSNALCVSPSTANSNIISMTVTGVVIPAVSISANPGSTTCAGTNVTFTATPVNGGISPSYQWKLNGNNVGTNSATYQNAALITGDIVSCVMTSSFACASPASATSNNITMTVNPVQTPSVSIAANPGNTICAGTNVTFTATPNNGGASPVYQWKVNGNNIGTNSATYMSSSLANGDIVTCVLTPNIPCPSPATATSNAITMTVNPVLTPSISIAANPGNTICAGTNVLFTATPINGGATPAYQWKLNGNNVGANSSTYQNAALANSDVVTCVLTSSVPCPVPGTATSNAVTMTVNPVLVPSVSIAANPGNIICAGTNVMFTATPTNGGTTPAYQWKLNGNNVGANSTSYQNAALINGDVVTCVLTSNAICVSPTTATSNIVTMTVNPILTPSVSIVASPGTIICANTNVTFTATPTNGGASPSYQWKLNGGNVGTNSTTYQNATLTTGDMVSCIMTTSVPCPATPTATSNIITMTVSGTVVPSVSIAANPGNTICAGTNVMFTATPTNGGTTPTYQWKVNGSNVGTNSITYQNGALANGDVVICVMTSSFACAVPPTATSNGITMAVTPNVTPSVTIAANPGNTICTGTNVTFTATPTNGGTTPVYQWRLNGNNVGTNSSTYQHSALVSGDVVTCVLTSNATCASPTTATSNAITMTVNPILTPSVSITANPGNTICAGTNVTFTASPTNGGPTPAYQWKLNGNNVGANSATYQNASLANADVVTCVMTSSVPCPMPATATSNAVTMTVNPVLVPALSIVANPGSTICPATTLTFTATPVNGGASPVYQWKLNGNNVGTNSVTYQHSSLTNGDIITCVMTSNATCASPVTATSNGITITLNAPPSISTHPQSQTVFVGANVTFTTVATGTGLMYQWRKGGVNISGATSNSYTITGVVTGDAGNYDVVVSGTCSPSSTSNTAILTVNAVMITIQPANQSICVGANAVFSIVASGPNLTYQWQVSVSGGPFTNISGATASTLSFSSVAQTLNGNQYRCVVSGIVTSAAAVLTVYPLPIVNLVLPVDTVYKNTSTFLVSGGSPSGGIYSGASLTGLNFVPSSTSLGNYTIGYNYMDVNGCAGSASDIITLLPAVDLVNIYPNPSANGLVNIVVAPELVGGNVRAYNAIGQQMKQWYIAGKFSVHQLNWISGTYILVFRNSDIAEIKKIIIGK